MYSCHSSVALPLVETINEKNLVGLSLSGTHGNRLASPSTPGEVNQKTNLGQNGGG